MMLCTLDQCGYKPVPFGDVRLCQQCQKLLHKPDLA